MPGLARPSYARATRPSCARLVGALVASAACGGLALSGASCGAFSSTDPLVADASSSSSSGGSSSGSSSSGGEAGADAPARVCREERNDFEQPGPLAWFDNPTVDADAIFKLTTAPAPKGTTALFAQVTVPTTGGGRSAYGPRKMDVAGAKVAEIENDAYFGRAPTATTYVEVGCELTARKSASEMGVTTRLHLEIDDATLQLGGASNDGSGSLSGQPTDVDVMTVQQPAWHHVLVRMELATGAGLVKVDDVTRTIAVPPAVASPQVFTTKCGVPYADKTPGKFEVYLDDITMRLCDR